MSEEAKELARDMERYKADHRPRGKAWRADFEAGWRAGRQWTGHHKCSFCGKDRLGARLMIAGAPTCICDECVDVCLDIVAERADKSSPGELEGA